MGRIFDRFGHLKFHNEAEVSQNFLIPLLTEFLGYRGDEILPEHVIDAFCIPQSREGEVSTVLLPPKAKPDYIVTIDKQERVLVCDSKGPKESLDDYLHQLLAYCIALRTNLLLTTNGTELRVYSANALVFKSTSVEELDLRFSELYKLLNRTDAAKHTDVERIQTLDLYRSLSKDSEALQTERYRQVAIALSDFAQYLDAVCQASAALELPAPIRSAFESDLQRFPAEGLYSFQEYARGDLERARGRSISYRAILQEAPKTPMLMVGESGIGKTSLLQQILLDKARTCLEHRSDVVPVLVKLGQYSRSRSVLELISEALISKGTSIAPSQLPSLLRDGRFIILFDAFDEVFEPSVPEVEREVQSLMDNYPKCKIVITTRHFRLPRLTPIRRYELQPLSHQKIEAFARMYLGSDCRAFLDEIARKGLVRVASNTLLLTLLILLYLREGKLPRSRGQILQAVVDRVCDWDQHKAERFMPSLPWKIREELLTQLAFSSLSSGKSYALDKQSVEMTLAEVLSGLENRRQVPLGLTLDQVLNSLAATGFILRTDEGIVFWHRAFVEHFAAAEIARRLESAPDLLEELIKKPEWEDVLPLTAPKASDPSSFIEEVLIHNVFTAARVLLECNKTEGDVYRQSDSVMHDLYIAEVLASFDEPEVVQQLTECANDPNLSSYARARFAEALSKSKGIVPLHVFEALAQDESDDVKTHAIRGLGRFSFEDVRTLVLRAVHPPPLEQSLKLGFSFARVQAAAFEVLAQYGRIELLLEEENRPEYFYNISLEVLFEAVSSHHLYSMIPLVEAIIERTNDERGIIKAAWVLADLGHVDRAQEIIDMLRRDRLSQGWVAHDIVKGIHRLPASYALSIVDEALSRSEELERGGASYLRMLCIEALVRIGTSEACERLAQIAWANAEDAVGIDAEHALRGIEFLAPRERENWLLQLINEHPGMGGILLQRALDTLGIIGSQDSLPLLQKYFNDPYPDNLQAICFWAIHNINKRAGQLWFNGEERGL